MVIGASGFIGSRIVRILTARGCRVTALHHRKPVRGDGVRSVKGDLRTFDWTRLEDDLPEVIIHSGRISGRTLPGRILAGMQGRRANRRLVSWLSGFPDPPSLVFVSGTLVYGSRGELETYESAPLNPTGFQKYYVQAEYPVRDASRAGTLPVYIMRIPWVLGPDSWFRQFYWRAMQKRHEIPCFGDGKNVMSVVHIRDCAGLIVRISESAAERRKILWTKGSGRDVLQDGLQDDFAGPGVYNITTMPAISQRTFCETFSGICGIPVRYYDKRQLKSRYGKTVTEALTFSLSLASAQDAVNTWQPEFPAVDAALEDVVRSLERRNAETSDAG